MLRAKKPTVNKPRFKALIYSNTGVGKTHFCCSFPNTYYIDSEGVQDYPHFVQMIIDNNGEIVVLKDLTEIIAEVKLLLSTEHKYKTLVIDSLSFPFGLLGNLEAERLAKKTRDSEGTEYGANLAKGKRLTFHLGILLSRLDMNVIVTSHEKTKYQGGQETGKTYDINEKMAYSLGTILHLRQQGGSKKAFIEKSRYPQLPTGASLDFDDGFGVIRSAFGDEVLTTESAAEKLATPEQVSELKRLISDLNITDENVQKLLIKADSQSIEEIQTDIIQKYITSLKARITQGDNAA